MSSRQCCLLHVKETINRYPQMLISLFKSKSLSQEQILARIKSNRINISTMNSTRRFREKRPLPDRGLLAWQSGHLRLFPAIPTKWFVNPWWDFTDFMWRAGHWFGVKLSARRNSATRPAVFYSGVDQAESLFRAWWVGDSQCGGTICCPKYEVVLYSISPIPVWAGVSV